MNTNTHKVTVGKVVQYLILILMFLLLVGPFVWELSLSFKGKGDNVYAVPPYLMPKTPTLENYISVFKQVPVFHYMLNTLVVCLISIFGNVVFSTMAGYALGRLKWRGRGLVFTMFMGTMVIPIEGVMISQFLIIRSIHLQNTLLAVALPGLCGAINILLMTHAFRSIPMELDEAAMVDGAGKIKQTIHVTMPGIAPFIALMTIMSIGSVLNAGFDQIFNLYSPAVYATGDIIDTLVYRLGLINQQYSLSAAVGLLKSVVSCILVLTGYKLADKYAGYKVW